MGRLTNAIVGRDTTYFDLFEEAAANAVEAADLLERLFAAWPEQPQLAREIGECEGTGDRITHDVIHHLNQTFVTPIEREDILELAGGLDDIVDEIEEAADYLVLYKIEAPMEQAQKLTEILALATRQIAKAMPRLRDFKDIRHYVVEVHRLENEGDRVSREAMASLFDGGIDPMVVIRWKDVYERLEEAIDACEHCVDILEGILIKNS